MSTGSSSDFLRNRRKSPSSVRRRQCTELRADPNGARPTGIAKIGDVAEIVTWVCWTVVVVTWVVGAVYGARNRRSLPQTGSGSGTLWRVGSVVAGLLIYRLGRHGLQRTTDHSWWIELPGLVLLVASTAFTIWARVRLGRMWSASPNVLQAEHELRTDGPYSVTRHPIYTGLLGMLLGSVLLNGLGAPLG